MEWNEVQCNDPNLNEMILIKILRFHFMKENETKNFNFMKGNKRRNQGMKCNEKAEKEIK